eukprot:m.6001 g.6001  ORF g.6001 m.6001 type:complete len:59 (+) comp14665_c0_seq1:1481-1657(+)
MHCKMNEQLGNAKLTKAMSFIGYITLVFFLWKIHTVISENGIVWSLHILLFPFPCFSK